MQFFQFLSCLQNYEKIYYIYALYENFDFRFDMLQFHPAVNFAGGPFTLTITRIYFTAKKDISYKHPHRYIK